MNSKNIIVTGMIGLLAGVAIISCTKASHETQPQNQDFSNSSLAQVFIATVGATRNYVYVDGKAVTGAALTSGSLFPANSGAFAFSVPGGLRSFLIRDTLATSTQVPLSFAQNMQVGRNYTIFAYDTTTAPKQVTVPTNITILRDTTNRLRFAHFIYSPVTGEPAVDVYSRVRATNLFAGVANNTVTEFIPYFSRVTDTFDIREAGTTNLLLRVIQAGGLTDRRNYTLVYRGSNPRGTWGGSRTYSLFLNY